MRNFKLILNKILMRFQIKIEKLEKKEKLIKFISKIAPVKTKFKLIRIGGSGDGGYLVPNDLTGIKYCYSPGVADTANFELELASRGIKSFLADFSVENPPINNELFEFKKKYLGSLENDVYMTLESWLRETTSLTEDKILQMDIEGAEYETLISSPSGILAEFRIIVIEFHGLSNLVDRNFFRFAELAFEKLLRDFHVVHLHPNNAGKILNYKGLLIPDTLEITFLRKDRSDIMGYVDQLPNLLDKGNVPGRNDVKMPSSWLKDGQLAR